MLQQTWLPLQASARRVVVAQLRLHAAEEGSASPKLATENQRDEQGQEVPSSMGEVIRAFTSTSRTEGEVPD